MRRLCVPKYASLSLGRVEEAGNPIVRHVSTARFLGLCASLALVMTTLPSTAQPQRDICVEVLQPVASDRISSVEVTIRDCFPHPPLQNPPPVLPALSFDAVLEVSSEGKRICGATTRVNVFGPALPPVLSKIFRFQVVYTLGQGPSQLPGQLTRAVLYMIKASAHVDDGSPVNNLSTMAVRFPPGGAVSCVVIPKPSPPRH
jgi:hypothetical protein